MVTPGENPVLDTWTPVRVPDQWATRYFWDFIFSWLHKSSGPQYIGNQAFLSSLSHDQRNWMVENIRHDYMFDKKTACLWFQEPREAMLFQLTFC